MTANMSSIDAVRKLTHAFVESGPLEAATLIRKNLAECARQYVNRRFDRTFNVETSGLVQLRDLTCNSNNKAFGIWYEPTPLRTLKCMFSMLPHDLSEFSFIDYGSGKGRTLLYAANYNFRRIIGIEFARELHTVAERNLHIYRNARQKCFDISTRCMDAVEFSLPEEKCVLYFFHPFKEEVMRGVLANIEASFRNKPRQLFILYYHPQLSAMLTTVPFLRKCGERKVPFDISAEPCIYRRKLQLY